MAELHEALKALSPTDWDDVPVDDLKPYMTELLTAGELICNSVPPPSEGTAFHQAKPHYDEPNRAKSHKDVYPSLARSFPPGKEHENLQKNWGKAMKFSAKENPLNIAVYKMAGHDRHGAWFARRSVHEGMGFAKFKNAMKREFAESLAVEGPPGSGSIRGIGADTRLERKEVEGLGALEVYQLSAQFPGPTTPREFIPLILTSDCSLTDMSAATLSDGKTHIPRSHMILSRPVTHPDAPERQGYILGKYESVELIREIPLSQAKEGGDSVEDTSELNPVEWIMITRSDPGGGIPRFMVDRGTPSAMLGDVHKWLDWATNFDEDTEVGTQPPEKITPAAQEAAAASADGSGETDGPIPASPDARKRASTVPAAPAQVQPQQEGVVSHLTQALEAGIDAYAPTMVSSYMHNRTDSNAALAEDSDSSDSSSVASFMSAEEMRRLSTAEALPDKSESPAASSQISLTSLDTAKKDASHHDKEVHKIAKQREKLDRKLAKKREEEEARLQKMKESESGEREKAKERHDREVKKSEERHRRELEKLEAKKEKEAQKAAQKKQKRDERDVVMRVTRERDEFRSQSELLKREVELLHEQIGELQKENTSMASKLGKVGGQDALSDVGAKGSSSASIGGRSRTSTRGEK